MNLDQHGNPEANGNHQACAPSARASAPVRVQASSIGDLVALVPYLTGYRLEHGLVVLVYQDGRIHLTASVPMAASELPDGVHDPLVQVLQRFPAADFIVIGYHPDRDAILPVLRAAQALVPNERLIDLVHSDNERYWSLICEEACCPPEGVAIDPHSPAAVQAVLAGAVAEPSRDAIAERVSGPSPAHQARDWLDMNCLLEAQGEASGQRRSTRLDALLATGSSDAAVLSHHELLELACMVTDIAVRDQAWLAITRDNADVMLALWLRVVAVAPDPVATPAICLTGLAAWIGGHGALLTVCVERAEELGDRYSLRDILADIQARAVPPSAWDRWRLELLDLS